MALIHPGLSIKLLVALAFGLAGSARSADLANWRMQEIATDLDVGYAVRILDMAGDARPDILVIDSERVVCYENPSWKVHTLLSGQTQPDNVCTAPHDIDGDGDVDLALGAGWAGEGGTLQWLENPGSPGQEWTVHAIGTEPFIHRMQWVNADYDEGPELVVVPLVGRGGSLRQPDVAPIRILAYKIPAAPATGEWPVRVLSDDLHVAHNFWPLDFNSDGASDLLVASYDGVTLLVRSGEGEWQAKKLGTGNQEEPNRARRFGASEIRSGKLAGDTTYIATIEPWHGYQVVVYLPPAADNDATGEALWQRQVLDEDLTWGHAVWTANLDADADEELIIGVRDNTSGGTPSGVRIFDPADGGKRWERTLVDPGGVAVEDLAVEDLNGDGRPDIVAVGRATKNVRIYWGQ
jgi:hypothetical protein